MTPQEIFVGRLRRHRERNHISLEEISSETRIKRDLLEALERPQHLSAVVGFTGVAAHLDPVAPDASGVADLPEGLLPAPGISRQGGESGRGHVRSQVVPEGQPELQDREDHEEEHGRDDHPSGRVGLGPVKRGAGFGYPEGVEHTSGLQVVPDPGAVMVHRCVVDGRPGDQARVTRLRLGDAVHLGVLDSLDGQ